MSYINVIFAANNKAMEKYLLKTGVVLFAMAMVQTVVAQIPDGYYVSLNGKKGAELKTAVHNIIKTAKVLDYGSGSGHTWEGFYTTDRTDDNMVIDRYSDDTRYFGSKGSSVSGMNIEHSFPKSWWGGSSNQAYKDLYNLMPSEQKINSSKSNYPMGKVTNVKTDNGCTKVGTGRNGYQLWEPADKWKGDFARGYMYMATAYQNFTWSGTQALQILQQGDYPTLQPWAYTLYIEWAKADKVDAIEIKRNNEVYKIQGNRNPYVDFPNLMEYIWGDSIDYAFDPDKTEQSSHYNGGGGPSAGETDVYKADFLVNDGGCTVVNTDVPSSGFTVWKLDALYGWKGTAFNGGANKADATLYTPEIDLSEYSTATLMFNHAVNYSTSPSSVLFVEVVCDGQTTVLQGIKWPSGSTWAFNESGDISLNDFAGKKIRIAFHYTSTASAAATWEINRMTVRGKKIATSVTSPSVSSSSRPDFTRPYEMYTIDGRRINSLAAKGIVIIKQDGKAWKFVVNK